MESLTLGAILKKQLDLVKLLRAGQWSGALTQLLGYVLGFVTAWLVGQSDLIALHDVAGVDLASANLATLALVGIGGGSLSGIVSDAIKAVDNTTTTALPSLLSGKVAEVIRPVTTVVANVPGPPRKAARKAQGGQITPRAIFAVVAGVIALLVLVGATDIDQAKLLAAAVIALVVAVLT